VSYASEVLADTPLGYWRLGETAGATTAGDSSGASRNGSCTGVTFGAAGLLIGDANTAASFAGAGQINLGNPVVWQSNDLTLEAWIKTSTVDSGYRTVIAGDSRPGLYVRSAKLITHDRGTDRIGPTVADGVVHHVVLAGSNTDNQALIYVDGQLVLTTTVKALNFGQPLGIGNNPGTSTPFIGTIDEVAVYAGRLSAARIAAHYQAGLGAAPGGLKVWNGSAWVTKPMKVWTGAAWAVKPVKRWNGPSWQLT